MMIKQILKTFTPLISSIRFKGYVHKGGIRYPGGIVYYPRSENQKDPEIIPSKLFRVERIKSTKHHPYWQKHILEELKILEGNRIAIVKNIPEVNAKLWKIKHLIRVTPIVFPYGEPSKDDINYTILKENGECVVIKKLEPVPEQVEALEAFDSDPKKMNSTTLKRESRHRWNNAYTGGF